MSTAKWKQVIDLETAATQDWTREALARCDPYLVWADAVTRKAAQAERDMLDIAVLIELGDAQDIDTLVALMSLIEDSPMFIPNGFEPRVQTRFVTGLVNQTGLSILIQLVVARKLVERFSVQDSRPDIARMTKIGWRDVEKKKREPLDEERDGPLPAVTTGTYLGIVDDGLPVWRLRAVGQLTGKPVNFWDQGWQTASSIGAQMKNEPPKTTDAYWKNAWVFSLLSDLISLGGRGFFYGRQLKTQSESSKTVEPIERDAYALSRYFSPAPRRSHGAATLGLLAPWISEAREPAEWPAHISGLAMVQLPTRTVLDTSGGSLAMRVLDGLRYVLWQEAANRDSGASARPIVANVSYGVHAGPHDGTSMFERAVDEMLDAYPTMHLVLPGGNAAQAGCHARRSLSPAGKKRDSASIKLQVLPDNGRDTFVEIWLPHDGKVVVGIRPPGSSKVYEIVEGEARIHFIPERGNPNTPARVHFGAVYAGEVAQGTHGRMVLVAIASTKLLSNPEDFDLRGLNQQPRRPVHGPAGLWELTVRNVKPQSIKVDAWIERGDAAPDQAGGDRQAFFPDSCSEAVTTNNATPEYTMNGIATLEHPRLHVVGAMRADGVLSDYSAAGRGCEPHSRGQPDVVVPADTSRNLPGVRTTGFVRGAIDRINGTSAACAVYARALAKQLAEDPTKLPEAAVPADVPPEIDCVPEDQPQADPVLRGQRVRQSFPFEVDL